MIEFINISKTYKGGTKALDNVSFLIDKGDFAFIVGPSGSGKSTLIKLLLTEEKPTSGVIIINDKDVTNLKHDLVPYHRRNIGVVFQDFRLLQNKTVYENVEFAMKVVGASSRDIRRQVPNVINLVGLQNRMRSYPTQLSGGEQQRVALARALVNNPAVLIADEPTGNLDPETSMEIIKLIDDINRIGTTIFMVTHDRDIVNKMKKRVITLDNGSIIRDDKKGIYGYEI